MNESLWIKGFANQPHLAPLNSKPGLTGPQAVFSSADLSSYLTACKTLPHTD